MMTLRFGSTGAEVARLQDALRGRGFNPGASDGSFGRATEAAVVAFQRSEGLLPDGVVGPRTAAALGLVEQVTIPSVIPGVTVEIVAEMFPGRRCATSNGICRSSSTRSSRLSSLNRRRC